MGQAACAGGWVRGKVLRLTENGQARLAVGGHVTMQGSFKPLALKVVMFAVAAASDQQEGGSWEDAAWRGRWASSEVRLEIRV